MDVVGAVGRWLFSGSCPHCPPRWPWRAQCAAEGGGSPEGGLISSTFFRGLPRHPVRQHASKLLNSPLVSPVLPHACFALSSFGAPRHIRATPPSICPFDALCRVASFADFCCSQPRCFPALAHSSRLLLVPAGVSCRGSGMRFSVRVMQALGSRWDAQERQQMPRSAPAFDETQ